jgi:hypothetical protein
MYRLTLRSVARSSIVTRSAPRTAPALFVRNKSAHSTNTSQGHTVDKSSSTLHKDKDVQSAAARAAKHERAQAESGSQAAGFDAARQGGQTGEAKGGAEGTGALKDQVGGQPGGTPGKKQGKQDAPSAGGTMASQLKNALGMDDRKPGVSGYDGSHESTLYSAGPQEPQSSSITRYQRLPLLHTIEALRPIGASRSIGIPRPTRAPRPLQPHPMHPTNVPAPGISHLHPFPLPQIT